MSDLILGVLAMVVGVLLGFSPGVIMAGCFTMLILRFVVDMSRAIYRGGL